MTTTREEYLTKLKGQLDHWNTEMAAWEAKAKLAKEDASKRYASDLEELRAQREKALYQLKLLEGASTTAWKEIAKGADEAWDRMSVAIASARSHFEKH
jgi:hypothetical protein